MASTTSATIAPMNSWKSLWGTGIPGTTMQSCSTSAPASSRTPTRCAGWTTPANSADHASFKQQIAETGRDPKKVAVAAGVYTVVAETRAEAEDKVAFIDSLPKEIDQLSLLCEVLNVDLAKKPIDEPWSEEEIQTWTGAQGLRDRVYRILGKRNP